MNDVSVSLAPGLQAEAPEGRTLVVGQADIAVSVVIPAYNEEAGLQTAFEVISRVLEDIGASHEIIFVNDGSRDGTLRVIDSLVERFPTVVGLDLSRNFGKEAAMGAGLESARGACVIFIDADLQHPPELIPQMVEKWRAGADVVNAVKRSRGDESFVYGLMARAFNGLMTSVVGADSSGASDFKLIDRQVAEAVKNCPERNRFFRGLVAWVGFRVEEIPFDVQERVAGESKWSSIGLIRYSLRNLIAFSSWPLMAVAYTGFAVVSLGVLLLAQTLFNYFSGRAQSGFTTVIAVQIVLSGMILFALGIIAIYIAKLYEEQKARPLFLVRRSRG